MHNNNACLHLRFVFAPSCAGLDELRQLADRIWKVAGVVDLDAKHQTEAGLSLQDLERSGQRCRIG